MFLLFLWLPSWWCQDTMIRWYLKKYSSFVTLIRIQHSNQICSILNFETTHTHTLSPPFLRCFEHCYVIRITIWPLWFVSFLSDDVSQLWRDSLGPGEAKAFASLGTRKSQPCLPRMRFGRKLALQVVRKRKGGETWLTWHKSWYSWKDFWTTKRWWGIFSSPQISSPQTISWEGYFWPEMLTCCSVWQVLPWFTSMFP